MGIGCAASGGCAAEAGQRKQERAAPGSWLLAGGVEHPGTPLLRRAVAVALAALVLLMMASLQPAGLAYGQQPAAPAAPVPTPSSLLQPTLGELRSTIAGLHTAKWKAPGPVKDEAQANIGSITRDLESTLPGLLAQADAAPGAVAENFVVYRNLDALYEVLLRVSGTAELAAPDEEAANVAHSLLTLDAARRSLADSILASSREQQLALAQARQPAPPVAVAHPPTPTSVVSDGPDPASTTAHRKTKPKAKAATPPPAQP